MCVYTYMVYISYIIHVFTNLNNLYPSSAVNMLKNSWSLFPNYSQNLCLSWDTFILIIFLLFLWKVSVRSFIYRYIYIYIYKYMNANIYKYMNALKPFTGIIYIFVHNLYRNSIQKKKNPSRIDNRLVRQLFSKIRVGSGSINCSLILISTNIKPCIH